MRDDAPRYLDCGESALSVEFGARVDPALSARVLSLDAALRAAPIAGLRETTPTYRALFIRYEPLELSRDALIARIEAALVQYSGAAPAPTARWTLPCCYDPARAEDIVEAAGALGIAAEALARTHAGADYRAAMYGFALGWCYLSGLPPALALPRRATPRGPTPPGAVLIGGGLSLVAAGPMPTGWYVIGRTPERLFAPERDPPFLMAPGDAISFAPVDVATFDALAVRAQTGDIVARRATP